MNNRCYPGSTVACWLLIKHSSPSPNNRKHGEHTTEHNERSQDRTKLLLDYPRPDGQSEGKADARYKPRDW